MAEKMREELLTNNEDLLLKQYFRLDGILICLKGLKKKDTLSDVFTY